jgi:D-alanyl-lipoteichoic acid acyltransferase DltB (MBOAT superfamily)
VAQEARVISHLDPTYWAAAAGVAAWLPVAPVRKTTAFGAANLIVLGLMCGPAVAVAGLTFSVGLWVLLIQASAQPSRLTSGLAYLVPITIVLGYKTTEDWGFVRTALPSHGPLSGMYSLLLALSFSYVFLRSWDVTCSVLGKRSPLLDPIALVGYLVPFHMLLAGPIAAYDQHLKLNDPNTIPAIPDRILPAANDIATGLVYKFVCSEYLRIFAFGLDTPLASQSLADTAVLFVYLFFDFAGYSRIAIGTGTLLGVPTPANFRAPFAAKNVTDFFSRWHMTLGGFVQRNIYVPLQLRLVRRFGVRRALPLALVTLTTCWLFVGLWHRLSWRFALYGTVFALVVWAEKVVLERRWLRPAKAGTWLAFVRRGLGMAYVFVVITLMLHIVMGEIVTP